MQDRLIAFWPVNKGDGGVLKDITGNGYDVTLNSSYSGSNWSSLASPISSYRDGYRYGFNGKEQDKDLHSLTAYDYGFRIYNPALGRFLSVDPLNYTFPYYSPYHFAGNSPIKFLDLDGGEPLDFVDNWMPAGMSTNGGASRIEFPTVDRMGVVINVEGIYDKVQKQYFFVHKENNSTHWYYWKVNAGEDPTIMRVSNMAGRDNGHWAPFQTADQLDAARRAKVGRESANMLSTFFAGLFTAPFVVETLVVGVTEGAVVISEKAVVATTRVLLAAYKAAPAIGAIGRMIAEFLDETGSISAQNSGVTFAATELFAKYFSHIFSKDHIAEGIMKLGNSEADILKKIEKVVQNNLDFLKEGDNIINVRMNGIDTKVLTNVNNGAVRSVNTFVPVTPNADNASANIINDATDY